MVAGRLRTARWETPEGEKRSKMVMDADEVAASMTFATLSITRMTRTVPAQATSPDDPWTTASRTRPDAPQAGPAEPGAVQDPPF